MGLIRMGLAVSTAGAVSTKSRKQRVAAASLREMKAQTVLLAQIADPQAAERERAAQAARIEAARVRREAQQAARAQRMADRTAQRAVATPWVAPAWLVSGLRALGWLLVVVFAIGSLGALTGAVGGGLFCLALAGGMTVLLRKTGKVLGAR